MGPAIALLLNTLKKCDLLLFYVLGCDDDEIICPARFRSLARGHENVVAKLNNRIRFSVIVKTCSPVQRLPAVIGKHQKEVHHNSQLASALEPGFAAPA